MKRLGFLYVALVGAIVATLCDANHVYTQTLSYPNPIFGGQAWWVFPGFFMAFLLMGVVYTRLAQQCRSVLSVVESQTSGDIHAMVESVLFFAMVYLLSGFGNESPYLLAFIFYGTFALRLMVTYERGWLLLLASLLCVGGMVGEGLLSLAGLAAYRHIDVFGVPFWLGALYMHGAFALRESVRLFVYR